MRTFTRIILFSLSLTLAGCGISSPRLTARIISCYYADLLKADSPYANGGSAYTFVDLTNPGPNAEDYTGWQITDATGTYNVPPFSLNPGESFSIWRGTGQSNAHNFYLGWESPTWIIYNVNDMPRIHRGVFPVDETSFMFPCPIPSFSP